MELTEQEKLFIDEYMKLLHPAKAAVAAGYTAEEGYKLLGAASIKAEVARKMKESAMSASEVKELLAKYKANPPQKTFKSKRAIKRTPNKPSED